MSALINGGTGRVSLAITRSLGRRGVNVSVISGKKRALCFYSKYCKEKVLLPREPPESFMSQIFNMIKRKKYDVLFTNEYGLITKYRDKLEKYIKLPLPSDEKLTIAYNKAYSIIFARENNIPCPETYFVKSTAEVRRLREKLEYPVVIKPRVGSGSEGIRYVNSPEELLPSYREVAASYKNPLIQEYIPNGGAYGLEALFNSDSEPRAVFIHRRIREYPVTGGPSVVRESIKHPEVKRLGLKLLKALGWYGVAMVEFRIDPRDNKPKLMEINPRFWGSLQLSISAGVDFPYLLYRLAVDGDVKPVLRYRLGVKCRNLFGDVRHLVSVMKGIKNTTRDFKHPSRLKTLLDFFNFFEKDVYYDFFSKDDPLPAVIKILNPVIRRLE